MENTASVNQLCSICKVNKSTSTFKIYVGSKVTNYIVVAATITEEYLLIPTCELCEKDLFWSKTYRLVWGIFSVISIIFIFVVISSIRQEINLGKTIIYDLILFTSGVIGFATFLYYCLKMNKKFLFLVSKAQTSQSSTLNHQKSDKFQISSESILWIEKELLKLNKEICGEDRPEHYQDFFQILPKSLLLKDRLSANDVAEAATQLVNQTRERIGKLEVPFRKPRVEFTSNLPKNEPGHIEFGWDETIIRIHPDYIDNPFALASILCHELAHFILDHNGLRKSNNNENEKFTDFFVFKCGQGLIYLQGILDVTSENGQSVESRLGYLTLEEMAYSHVRCSSQYGLQNSKISPDYFSGKTFEEVKKASKFLTLKEDTSKFAEIILCPNNHILRILAERKSQTIRCPKCKWEKQIWMHKKEHYDFSNNEGIKEFNLGNFNEALQKFRQAQQIDKTNSTAFCWASRSLKKLGKHQDAIRELQKILSLYPEDIAAQNEMKSLIYE